MYNSCHTVFMNDPWQPVDPLGEALHFLRMSGTFYCRSEFTAPWGLTLPAMKACLMFHVVTAGNCWVELDGSEPTQLLAGNLALVPHGEGHRLVSAPGTTAPGLFDLPRELVSERYEILRHGGGGEATTVICGTARFDHPAALRLVQLLPALIKVDAWNTPETDWIQSTLRFVSSEAQAMRPGGETVITRLADVLVIQAIRAWLARDTSARSGWLGALRDRHIGRALALIHRNPSRNWTLAALADKVGMSRSAFSAHFSRCVGKPALHYVTGWKMQTAALWLRESDTTLAEVSARLGYDSEAAFSRAFKRHMGVSPGSFKGEEKALDMEIASG